MAHFSLLSTLAYPTTGRIWSFLHLLPLLLFSLGIGLALTRKGMIALRTNSRRWMYDSTTTTPVSRVMKNVLKILSAGERSVEKRLGLKVWTEEEEARNMREQLEKHIPSKEGRGFARIWAILSLFIIAASWSGWAYLAVTDHREIVALKTELSRYRNDTVVEHHILFGSKLDDGDFSYTSDEEPQGGAFRPCQSDIANHLDVPGILSKAEGYYADYGAWEERGTCKSILRADLGFWFKDKNTNFHVVRER